MTTLHHQTSDNMFHSTNMDRSANSSSSSSFPVFKRGLFFEDDFFKQSRDRFLSAMNGVMARNSPQDFMTRNFDGSSLFDAYRDLRNNQFHDSTQAATVTREGNIYKIVLDAKGFEGEELSVKVAGNQQLIVEGNQTRNADGSAKSKKFSKTFSLPGLKPAEISAVISSDGVFTISVPMEDSSTMPTLQIPIDLKKIKSPSQASPKTSTLTPQNLSINKQPTQVNKNTSSNSSSTSLESQSIRSQQHRQNLSSSVTDQTQIRNLSKMREDPTKLSQSERATSSAGSSSISESSSVSDMATKERVLKTNLEKPKRMSSITEYDNCYKLVLDVQEYTEGDINVKVSKNSELMIEGKINDRDPYCQQNSFRRIFLLNEMGNPDQITAIVSKDGILSVQVPKKNQQCQTTETNNLINEPNKQSLLESKIQQKQTQESLKEESQKIESQQLLTKQNLTNSTSLNSNTTTNVINKPEPKIEKKDPSQNLQSSNLLTKPGISRDEKNNLPGSKLPTNTRLLPITPTSSFFQNSPFAKEHEQFLEKVKEMREQFGRTSLFQNRNIDDKKSFLEKNKLESLEEKEQYFQVMLDVREFTPDEIQIKIINNNQLLIEANSQKKIKDSKSNQSFRRQFYLPDKINIEGIKSSMSADSILHIIIPKILPPPTKELIVPINVIEDEVIDQCTQPSSSSQSQQPNGLSQLPIGQRVSQSSNQECISNSMKQAGLLESSKMSTNLATASTAGHQNGNNQPQSTPEANSQNVVNNKTDPATNDTNIHLPMTSQKSFPDDAFKKMRDEFYQSMMDMSSNPFPSVLSNASNTQLPSDDTKVISVSEDSNNHKIVVNLADYKDGDISIRAESNNELIVEGKVEEDKTSGKAKSNFKRCFYLPGVIDMKNVTSAISSDGVLTIIAPKKQSAMQYIDEAGKVTQLQVAPSGSGGQGSSWQQEHEQTTSGDGYSSKVMTKSFQSHYSSSS